MFQVIGNTSSKISTVIYGAVCHVINLIVCIKTNINPPALSVPKPPNHV